MEGLKSRNLINQSSTSIHNKIKATTKLTYQAIFSYVLYLFTPNQCL